MVLALRDSKIYKQIIALKIYVLAPERFFHLLRAFI